MQNRLSCTDLRRGSGRTRAPECRRWIRCTWLRSPSQLDRAWRRTATCSRTPLKTACGNTKSAGKLRRKVQKGRLPMQVAKIAIATNTTVAGWFMNSAQMITTHANVASPDCQVTVGMAWNQFHSGDVWLMRSSYLAAAVDLNIIERTKKGLYVVFVILKRYVLWSKLLITSHLSEITVPLRSCRSTRSSCAALCSHKRFTFVKLKSLKLEQASGRGRSSHRFPFLFCKLLGYFASMYS